MPRSHKQDIAAWLHNQAADTALCDVVQRTATTCAQIADIVRAAPLTGESGASEITNVQGEVQKQLDIITNDLMVDALRKSPHLAKMVSEEVPALIENANARQGADLVICFDPLDGSSNIETNGIIGTIFSVLQLPDTKGEIGQTQVLAAAQNQVAAGYALYGPATLLVLTTGKSVAIFALDETTKSFFLVEDAAKIPQQANEFAINMAYARYWDAPTAAYIKDCMAGKSGPRNKAFNMRWMGSMVADVHRLFVRGGIFIYPALNKPGGAEGKLRFLYEANPMAYLVEVAGGRASTGEAPIRSLVPGGLHQRAPVALGSSQEVAELEKQHRTT